LVFQISVLVFLGTWTVGFSGFGSIDLINQLLIQK